MKKCFFIAIILFLISSFTFAIPNYNNGNGTIISESNINNVKIIIRKCTVEVTIGDLLREQNRIIFDGYLRGKEIAILKDNDKVSVLEICSIEYLDKPKDQWGNPQGELWYKIQKAEVTGWIHISLTTLGKYTDPYYNNRYEIIEQIDSSGKKWTIRSMDQTVSVWEKLNVRDKPGLGGGKLFLLHDFEEGTRSPQENYTVFAMTEETETIDGKTDHWLQIEYAPGKYGWIFGGYASVERGGPKYYIPENTVVFDLSWY